MTAEDQQTLALRIVLEASGEVTKGPGSAASDAETEPAEEAAE